MFLGTLKEAHKVYEVLLIKQSKVYSKLSPPNALYKMNKGAKVLAIWEQTLV